MLIIQIPAIVFMPLAVNTSVRLYDDLLCLIFLNVHREVIVLGREIETEILAVLAKESVMRISIPLDLSTRTLIPPSPSFHSFRPGSSPPTCPKSYTK